MPLDPQTARILSQHKSVIDSLTQQIGNLTALVSQLQSKPTTVQEEIDSQPGRRLEFCLAGEVQFTSNDLGQRSTPIIMNVSQDGPFVQTHYPLVLWRPSAPTNATNFGRWRPVQSAYQPTQQITTDFIDLLYEMEDAGSQRFMQNAARGPIFSRPDNIVPCPLPTVWSPNASVKFTPTYTSIQFNGATPPTQGTLNVTIPGYRIANM